MTQKQSVTLLVLLLRKTNPAETKHRNTQESNRNTSRRGCFDAVGELRLTRRGARPVVSKGARVFRASIDGGAGAACVAGADVAGISTKRPP